MKTAEDLLENKGRELFHCEPETTISEALRIMVDQKVGAILIRKKGRYVGIWTERDLMRNTITPGFDPKKALIGDHMSRKIATAPHSDNIYQLMDKFLGLRHRHIIIEKDGEYIGLISIGDILKAKLLEKDWELKELNKIASWEYYEHWQW